MKRSGWLVATAFAFSSPALAQIALAPAGSLRVEGDSTLHRWTSTATVVQATLTPAPDAPKDLAQAIRAGKVKGFEVRIPVAGLKSGESKMDKYLREAMREREHPDVLYKLASYTVQPGSDHAVAAKTTGELTINGVTKSVPMDVAFSFEPGGPRVQGSATLKMTDYGIKPPTLMFGSIKVRDPVVIRYDLLLAPQGQAPQTVPPKENVK